MTATRPANYHSLSREQQNEWLHKEAELGKGLGSIGRFLRPMPWAHVAAGLRLLHRLEQRAGTPARLRSRSCPVVEVATANHDFVPRASALAARQRQTDQRRFSVASGDHCG